MFGQSLHERYTRIRPSRCSGITFFHNFPTLSTITNISVFNIRVERTREIAISFERVGRRYFVPKNIFLTLGGTCTKIQRGNRGRTNVSRVHRLGSSLRVVGSTLKKSYDESAIAIFLLPGPHFWILPCIRGSEHRAEGRRSGINVRQ
ncbi:hypothetical protein KPH14_010846 [Odynerus spinipes]|uniref:Uncharacterized protein n=1 Tax=Odynerus spinipes TaxID=1348599 RepID=A0AAD9RH02_9HYME|nr:hypothetical protein KPH14_010846 [Odynerus spinipes]